MRAPVPVCKKDECLQKDKPANSLRYSYDIHVNLSDHTGTLNDVKLTSEVTQKLFDELKPKEFLELSDEKITELKWKVLLERWNLLVLVS